jgi:hypothetical protein
MSTEPPVGVSSVIETTHRKINTAETPSTREAVIKGPNALAALHGMIVGGGSISKNECLLPVGGSGSAHKWISIIEIDNTSYSFTK